MTKRAKKSPDFEEAMSDLESVVNQLESGHLTLEEAFFQFERGIKLVQGCQKSLSTLQSRIQILTEKNGQTALADFEDEDEL